MMALAIYKMFDSVELFMLETMFVWYICLCIVAQTKDRQYDDINRELVKNAPFILLSKST